MSGHSKWKNIAHRKGKQDASRGQLFTRLCRDVYAAAKRGGSNPDTNYHLKMALEKARVASVPSDTLARTLAKASGTLAGVQFEDFMYEGYAAGGVAVLLELSSDNRNRTAAEVRHLFSKYGGSLGESGCVLWMFRRVGVITVPRMDANVSEDDLTLIALEAGADDLQTDDEDYTIYTSPEDLSAVDQALKEQGILSSGIDIEYLPTTTMDVAAADVANVEMLLSKLEEHDDVQSVYTNASITDGMLDAK